MCDTSRRRQDLAGREQVEGAVFGHVVPEAGAWLQIPMSSWTCALIVSVSVPHL